MKRCGWCGTPIDEKCNPLPIEDCKKLTQSELNNAEMDYGNCCITEQEEDSYVTVTRDMATDAGDMSMEGQRIKW